MPVQKDPEGMETRRINEAVTFANRRVLEIGCGDGRLTWRYAHSAGGVTGIDLDADALQTASANRLAALHEIVSFVRADSLNLPFPHETFDLAIFAWSF